MRLVMIKVLFLWGIFIRKKFSRDILVRELQLLHDGWGKGKPTECFVCLDVFSGAPVMG